MTLEWVRRHRGFLRGFAVLVPPAIGGGLFLARDVVANSAAALVLVLAVVGIAASGDRIAGVAAGLSSAIGFDFFLTKPYLQLRIDSAEDVELTLLLLVVGLAVNELALWGLRENASASERQGFIRAFWSPPTWRPAAPRSPTASSGCRTASGGLWARRRCRSGTESWRRGWL